MSHAHPRLDPEPVPEEAGPFDATDAWSLRLTVEDLARSEVVLRFSSGALLVCRAGDGAVICALTMGPGAEAAGVFVRSERGALAVQVRRRP